MLLDMNGNEIDLDEIERREKQFQRAMAINMTDEAKELLEAAFDVDGGFSWWGFVELISQKVNRVDLEELKYLIEEKLNGL